MSVTGTRSGFQGAAHMPGLPPPGIYIPMPSAPASANLLNGLAAVATAVSKVITPTPEPVSSWDAVEEHEKRRQDDRVQGQEEDQAVSSLEKEENFQIRGRDARNLMMQKLIRHDECRVLVLRNMVGPEECDDELEGEVTEECSKFGKVDRVVIYQVREEADGDSSQDSIMVKLFVLFTDSDAVTKASEALNGRWFGGRQIRAEPYDQSRFEMNDLSG